MLYLLLLLVFGAKAYDDLQIVGSDKYYSYQPRRTAQDNDEWRTDRNHEEPSKNDYPVKIVQKYTDSDGNVRIVTSYNQRTAEPERMHKENLPNKPYEQTHQHGHLPYITTAEPAQHAEPDALSNHGKIVNNIPYIVVPQRSSSRPKAENIPYSVTPQRSNAQYKDPRKPAIRHEYTASKSIRFPDGDEQSYSKGHKTASEDGESSSYNEKSSYQTSYQKPLVKVEKTEEIGSKPEPPVEASGSSYVSDIGDLDEDRYDGGLRGYRGDDDYDHVHRLNHHNHGQNNGHNDGYQKGKGSSYRFGEKGSKGEKGGRGHKSQESYDKGHSDKYGQEQQQEHKKKESGEKAKHLDEANHYREGHGNQHSGKASEQEHSKGHKKGHKTKGFRTVHHKDEYKKDEVFYDEEHDSEQKKGHEHGSSTHKEAHGGNTHKKHHNSGYKDAHKGFKGDHENGQSYKNSKGHSDQAGHHHHDGHHAHHHEGAGHKGSESHGHYESHKDH